MIVHARAADDRGLSLIELIITVVVLGLIFMSLTAIFSNILTTQANVTRQSDATIRGQQFASSIEEAMRNAVEFKTDGSSLVVETSINGVVECKTFSAATAGVRVDALTFTYVDSTGGVTGSPVSGVRYSFSALGGPTSDGTTPGAAPPVFKGDAFARNTQTEADPTC